MCWVKSMLEIVYLPIAKKDIMLAVLQSMADPAKGPEAAWALVDDFDSLIGSLSSVAYLPNNAVETNIENRYRQLEIDGYTVFYDVNEQDKRIEIMRVLENVQ